MSADSIGISQTERLERLRAQLQGQPVGARSTVRAKPAAATKLLYGVMLRGAARLDAGLELTELEERMVACLRVLLSEEEVREFGRVYQQEQSARPSQMFPASLTTRGIDEGYALADLVEDLPGLRGEVMAQPNMSLVDLDRRPGGGSLDSAEFVEGLGAYGHGVTVVTASDRLSGVKTAGTMLEDVAVELDRFQCYRKSGELDRDEIYWALSGSSDTGSKRSMVTREYGEVVAGSVREFDSGTMLFTGSVDQFLTAHIVCWEADNSSTEWYDEMVKVIDKIAGLLFTLADTLAAYGGNFPVPEYHDLIDYVEIAGMVATAIVGLIELFRNHDDHVTERTFVFDRAALGRWISPTHDPNYAETWEFDGGSGGLFTLTANATGTTVAKPVHARLISAPSAPETVWNTDTALPKWPMRETPALTAVQGGLVCVAQRWNDNDALHWSAFDGTEWTDFTPIPGIEKAFNPSLATHADRAHCIYQTNGQLHMIVFDGTSWTSVGTHDVPDFIRGLHLCAMWSNLLCVIETSAGGLCAWGDPSSFSAWKFGSVGPFQVLGPVALGKGRGDANMVTFLRHKQGLSCTQFSGYDWSMPTTLPPVPASVRPAVAYSLGLHCVIRTDSGELQWSRLTETSWSPFVKHPTATAVDTPALAHVPPSHPTPDPEAPYGRLYCVYLSDQ